MRLLEELIAESWRTGELRSMDSETLRKIAAEYDAIAESDFPSYKEAVERASRLLALVRVKKTLRGMPVPEESLDHGILGKILRIIEILSSAYSGTLMLTADGRLLIRAGKPMLVNGVLIPPGSSMLVSLSEAADALAEGRAVPILPGKDGNT